MENFELKVREFAAEFKLSPREVDVLREMLFGNTTPDGISDALTMASNTAKIHIRAINSRFKTNSKTETIAKFIGFLFSDKK